MKQLNVLVTGAGGFIGSRVAALLTNEGYVVRAGIRHGGSDLAAGAERVACDLDRPRQIEAALDGVDVVVHAAYGRECAMVKQAESLLSAMATRKIVSLVAFSSIAVYGRRSGVIAEDDVPLHVMGDYARAKINCESLYRVWAAQNGERRIVVLRPGIVYGSGSRLWNDKMAMRILSGAWGVFGRQGEGRAALIHIDDLTRQCLAATALLLGAGRAGLAAVEPINCVGPESPRWNEYFQALTRALGQKPLRRWSRAEIIARQLLAAPAKVANRVGFPIAHRLALAPSSGELALFGLDMAISGEKARRLFGYAPTVGLADGLARSGLSEN